MKEFFENLKQKREEKGITLEDIHQKSRLSLVYLNAIETGDMDKLPSGYERIYLRRYAKEIGLSEDEVVRDFDLLTGRLTASTGNIQAEKKASPKKAAAEPSPKTDFSESYRNFFDNLNLDKINKIFWPSFGALILVVFAYIAYQQLVSDESSENLAIKEITISELMEKTQPGDSIAPPPVETGISTPRLNGESAMVVELKCKERVWVREVKDVSDTTEYILSTGNNRAIEANEQVQFLIGRADGVEIWLNGENLGFMGQEDEVALLVLTPAGIAQKRLRKVPPRDSGQASGDSTIVRNSGTGTL